MRYAGIVLLSVFAFSTVSCVRYYKTRDVKKGYKKTLAQTMKGILVLERDYTKRKEIYDAIVPYISSKQIPPYPILEKYLVQMRLSIKALKLHQANMRELEQKLARLVRNKKRIQSDKPEWKELERLNDKMEREHEFMLNEHKAYQGIAKRYNSEIRVYKITRIDTRKINSRLSQFNINATKAITETRQRINVYRSKLEKSSSKDKKSIAKKKKTLDDLQNILISISQKKDEIVKYSSAFKRESAQRTHYWAGPDMASHSILLKIVEAGKRINSDVAHFNKLTKQLD